MTSLNIQSKMSSNDDNNCGCISGFFKFIILGSYLAEDLIALYWQSDEFDDRSIFWIFYGFACASSIMECCGSLNKWVLLVFLIMIEATQAVLFMYICGWTELSIIVFSIFIGFQLIFECVSCFIESEPEDGEQLLVFQQVCTKCCQAVIGGIAMLPYLYYNDDSLFRSQWFDIYVTCTLWFGTTFQAVVGAALFKIQMGDKDDIPIPIMIFLVFGLFITFGNLIFSWILGIIYLPAAEPGFEYGWTMFIVVSGSVSICSICCQICLRLAGIGQS